MAQGDHLVPSGSPLSVKSRSAILVANPATPCESIVFDADVCIGCNRCLEVCRCDVLMPSAVKGEPPLLVYPDECWFCGVCVEHCPKPGAIRMEHPLNQRAGWKRKSTGQFFRVGMSDPPPPVTRPAVPSLRPQRPDGDGDA